MRQATLADRLCCWYCHELKPRNSPDRFCSDICREWASSLPASPNYKPGPKSHHDFRVAVSAEAEESLSEWLSEVERNHIQNEIEAEERAQAAQEQQKAETDA